MVAIIRSWRPDLLDEFGVGPIVAATVLCAWSHPGRIHSEAAFAMLARVDPSWRTAAKSPPGTGSAATATASSTTPAPVVQSRIQYQPAARDYVARRTAEGKTGREIKRCLARYVARDLYRLLENGPAAA